MSRHVLLGVCAGLPCLSWSPPALGQLLPMSPKAPSTLASPSESNPVEANGAIYLVGARSEFEDLRRVIGRRRIGEVTVRWVQLDRLTPESLLESAETTNDQVRCWIDLTVAGKASLFFADRSSQRFLVRDITVSNPLTELEKEALAQIIEVSMAALIDDATLGLSRDNVTALLAARATDAPAKPEPVAKMPTSPPSPSWQPFARVSFVYEAYSPQIRSVSVPGMVIGLTRQGPWMRPSFGLSVGYQVPVSQREDPAGLQLGALRLRAHLAMDLPFGNDKPLQATTSESWGVRIAAGADVITVEPMLGAPRGTVALEPSQTIAVPVVGTGIRVTNVMEGWSLSIGAQVDVALEQLSYDVSQDGSLGPVLRPYRVRPGVVAEGGWL